MCATCLPCLSAAMAAAQQEPLVGTHCHCLSSHWLCQLACTPLTTKIAHYCASFQVSGFNWFIIYWLYIYIKSYINTESCQESIAVYHCVWLPSVCDAVLPVADRRICYKYQKCVSNVAEESRVEPWWNESHWETDGSGHRSTRRVLALHIHSRARSQHLTLFD